MLAHTGGGGGNSGTELERLQMRKWGPSLFIRN